jgi:hypothetical protein
MAATSSQLRRGRIISGRARMSGNQCGPSTSRRRCSGRYGHHAANNANQVIATVLKTIVGLCWDRLALLECSLSAIGCSNESHGSQA